MEDHTTPTKWPEPDIPENEKVEAGKQCLNYAISRWRSKRTSTITSIIALRKSYNGHINESMKTFLEKQYGTQLNVRFVDYRLSRTKMDTIYGEFLQRPLRATVMTTNKDAVDQKRDRIAYLHGLSIAKKSGELDRLRTMGFDVGGGVDVPVDFDPFSAENNFKNKAEILANKAVSWQINQNKLKLKLGKNYKDFGIAAECFGKVFINQYGDLDYRPIIPENALFEEIEGDDFLERSPYLGERIPMTESELLQSFDWTPTEREELKSAFRNGTNDHIGIYQLPYNNQFVIDVFCIEWNFFAASHKKTSMGKGGQKIESFVSDGYYRDNKKKIERESKNGKYEFETRYKEELWEGYKIGNLWFKKIEKKKNVIASVDDPYPAIKSYTGCLFNTEAGQRVSFYSAMEEAKHQYNMVRWQINRELSKAKGTVLVYDRAFLPRSEDGKPMSLNTIITRMINDGIVDVNSAGDGNLSGRQFNPKDMVQQIDLSVSSNLGVLVQIAQNLEQLLDRISSVNDNRQGLAPASETVTNNQSNIALSRTMTEPMNYFFDRFIENVVMRICEYTKVAWYINPDRAVKVIGSGGYAFLEEIMDMRWYDYSAMVIDSRKEKDLRDRISMYMQSSLNKGEMTPQTAIKADLQETVTEMIAVVDNGWKEMKKVMQENEIEKIREQGKNQQQAAATMKENREDEQAHDLEMLRYKLQGSVAENTQKAKDKSVQMSQQAQNDMLLNKQQQQLQPQ